MRSSSGLLWCLPFLAAACMEERASTEVPPPGRALLQTAHSELGASGRALFSQALPGSNGRSCATCHVLDEATALSVENVEARLAANPNDPLFHPLDADDPDAAELTFEHLRKGLIRVTLPLPDKMDVVDLEGRVVTPPDRKIFVWRSVPSIANTAGTGPFQLDGRETDLEGQAQSALTAHSEGPTLPRAQLARIARFEGEQFSSVRALVVGTLLELGVPRHLIPVPERTLQLSAAERRGLTVYEAACAACHGGASTQQIVNRAVHDGLFFELDPAGNVIFDVPPGQGPVPRLVPHSGEFLNIGIGLMSGYGQMGAIPSFNDSVELPRYRFRFYRDGSRRQKLVDLPPIPVTASGDLDDITPALDERGAPIVGPSLGTQLFSTDPGRAAITGDPLDFEAFDVPQLRGLAHTAPYFHDNLAGSLREVVDVYSRFILPFLLPLQLPQHPPELPGFPAESLSPADKDDLIAFLRRL
jgi:cytochrome c peroxidase